MQRPIIFVATNDTKFEQTAMDAVLKTAHGMRRAHELCEACDLLAQGTHDIAMAIIDLDLDRRGVDLLKALGSSEPEFPILAIADNVEVFQNDDSIAGIAIDYLLKPVAADELRQTIRELCQENAVATNLHRLQLREQRRRDAQLTLAA